jgi:hypothetical protein
MYTTHYTAERMGGVNLSGTMDGGIQRRKMRGITGKRDKLKLVFSRGKLEDTDERHNTREFTNWGKLEGYRWEAQWKGVYSRGKWEGIQSRGTMEESIQPREMRGIQARGTMEGSLQLREMRGIQGEGQILGSIQQREMRGEGQSKKVQGKRTMEEITLWKNFLYSEDVIVNLRF